MARTKITYGKSRVPKNVKTKLDEHDTALDKLDGTVTNNQTVSGPLYQHVVTVPDGATADIDVVVTRKFEVLDVIVQKQAGAGGGSDTITVKNGATAITDAVDINIADKVVKRAATIDDAQSVIAAGGTLRVTRTKVSANNVACLVTVLGILRA
jgi:hypothetical protein